jgi:hypothetical protein
MEMVLKWALKLETLPLVFSLRRNNMSLHEKYIDLLNKT